MPTLTPKIGIQKPLGNETVTRSSFNTNWDIIDAGAQKNISQSVTAPATPITGDLWIDTSTGQSVLRRFDASNWVTIGAVTAAEVGAVANAGETPSVQAGLDTARPAAGTTGRLYIETNTQTIWRDTGTSWLRVGIARWENLDNRPTSFTPSNHGNEFHEPDMALASELTTHAALTNTAHGAVSAPTANTLMQRDAGSRSQVADGIALDDITTVRQLNNLRTRIGMGAM